MKGRETGALLLNRPRAGVAAVHRTLGNGGTARLARYLQAKSELTVGAPGDRYEREADAVADRVMATPEAAVQRQEIGEGEPPAVQAQVEEEEEPEVQAQVEEEEEEPIQAKGEVTAVVTPSVKAELEATRGSGTPLSRDVRAFMEPRFGRDFGGVRVHTGARAASLAKGLRAQAFTRGSDIYFASGKYAPATAAGKRLVAHELAHTVQQGAGVAPASVQRTIGDGHDLESPRYKGDVVLEACYDDERLLRYGNRGPAVAKVQEGITEYFLEREGRDPLPVYGVDGIFKSETKRAVEDFQASEGLTGKHVDGIVGPITMDLLDKIGGRPEPPLPELPPYIPPYKVPKWQTPPKWPGIPGFPKPGWKGKQGPPKPGVFIPRFIKLRVDTSPAQVKIRGPAKQARPDLHLGDIYHVGSAGATFTAEVSGGSGGVLFFSQVITESDRKERAGRLKAENSVVNEYDGGRVYNNHFFPVPVTPPIKETDTPGRTANVQSTLKPETRSTLHFIDKFRLYLMWAPSQAAALTSAAVALAALNWWWEAKATGVSGNNSVGHWLFQYEDFGICLGIRPPHREGTSSTPPPSPPPVNLAVQKKGVVKLVFNTVFGSKNKCSTFEEGCQCGPNYTI